MNRKIRFIIFSFIFVIAVFYLVFYYLNNYNDNIILIKNKIYENYKNDSIGTLKDVSLVRFSFSNERNEYAFRVTGKLNKCILTVTYNKLNENIILSECEF